MADLESLVIKLQLNSAQLQTGLNQAQGKIKNFGKSAEGASEGLKKVKHGSEGAAEGLKKMLVAGAVVGFLYEASKAAAEDATSLAILKNQLHNATGATEKQTEAIDGQLEAMSNMSATKMPALRTAFSSLVRATGDSTKALKLQRLALDVAAGAHVPVSMASKALGKAINGNVALLVRLDPKLKGSKNILGDTAKAFKGAAEAAGDADPYKKIGVIMENIKVTLGKGLLPIIKVFADLLLRLMPIVKLLGTLITQVVARFMPFIQQLVGKLMPVLTKVANVIMHIVQKVMPILVKIISKVVMPIISALVKILDGGLIDIIMQLVDAIMPLVNTLADMLAPIIGIVIDLFMMLWQELKPLIDILLFVIKVVLLLVNFALKPLKAIFLFVHKVIEDKIMPIFNKLMKALKPVADFIRGALVKGFKVLSDTLGWLWSNVIQPIIDGLMSLLGMGAETTVAVKVKKPSKADVKKALDASFDNSMMNAGVNTGGAASGATKGGKTTKTKSSTGHTINTTVNAQTNATPHQIAAQIVNAIKFNLPVAGAMGGGSMGSQVALP
jgi:hypothetical protein